MPDIFLSYSREDQAIARRFAEALEREGFKVWWDAAINPGETFDQVTEQALKDAKAVVVLWSKRSVASRWVRSEASQADRYGTLVPVTIEACDRPIMFELSQTTDLSNWNGKPGDASWRAFVESLHRFATKGATAAGSAPSSISHAATPGKDRAFHKGITWAAMAAAIVAGALLVWSLQRHRGEPASEVATTEPSVTAQPTQAPVGRTSVAVMPFENRTGDVKKEYFGDGLAEELINALTRLPGLQVPARSSTFAYKGRSADARAIASDLNVDAVLEGSVRSAGDTIRLTAELVDGRTGFHLWSQTYERNFKDLFKLQDELTNEIVQAVGKHFHAVVPASVVVAPPTRNLEAYSLYLQARSIASNAADFDRTLQLLDEALRIDPGFAAAKAQASMIQLAGLIAGMFGPEMLATSEAQARDALRLDPDLALAHAALGSIASLQGRWVEAAEHYQRARELEPGSGQNTFAIYLAGPTGKGSEVEAAVTESYRQAPDNGQTVMLMAAMNMMFGRNAEAKKFVELAIQFRAPRNTGPIPRVQSDLRLRARDFDGAAEVAVNALTPEWRAKGAEQTVRAVYAGIADPRRSKQASAALKSFVRNVGPVALFQTDRELRVISWFALLGDLDAAYAQANQLVDAGRRGGMVGRLWVWVWVPELLPFRRDPRFQPLMEKIGLMDYWRKYGPPDSCELANNKLSCH